LFDSYRIAAYCRVTGLVLVASGNLGHGGRNSLAGDFDVERRQVSRLWSSMSFAQRDSDEAASADSRQVAKVLRMED